LSDRRIREDAFDYRVGNRRKREDAFGHLLGNRRNKLEIEDSESMKKQFCMTSDSNWLVKMQIAFERL